VEDIISLTPKQLKGLVWHLNEELYRQQVHGNNDSRIITERLLELCVNCYNNTNIASSFEEQDREQRELELTQHSPRLVDGLKWSDKDYGKAFKSS
tara:strand:+ start:223 stop:510 length:288 start_codon:yes stop_codon:yes gene_type:complete